MNLHRSIRRYQLRRATRAVERAQAAFAADSSLANLAALGEASGRHYEARHGGWLHLNGARIHSR